MTSRVRSIPVSRFLEAVAKTAQQACASRLCIRPSRGIGDLIMKRLSLGIAVTAALGFVAGSVSADDVPVKTAPAVVPALYNWSGSYVGALAHVGHAKTAKRVKTVKAAATNRAALGLKLVGEELRMVVFQNRLRGLCEVEKAEQVSADTWRASCTNGGAFVIKVYPDGFMTV